MVNHESQFISKTIHVAILSDEPLGWASGKHYFPMILDNYSWHKENVEYKFKTSYITDKEIRKGVLNIKKFDVFLVPGGGVGDGEAVVKGFSFLPHVKQWKKQIQRFIKEGGSYVGICGGTALCTDLTTHSGKHKTFVEKLYQNSAIGISDVSSYYKHLSLPIFFLDQNKYPERIGAMGYIFSFAPGETIDGKRIHTGGVPIDFTVNKNHPIFADFKEDKLRIRWWGGPALIIPNESNRKIDSIANYPPHDLSEDSKTRIFAWRYIGGLRGLIKGLMHSFLLIKTEKLSLKDVFLYAFFLSGSWQKTDRKIHLDHQNKASITTEIFPNEHKGRILLCTSHPEYMIWWNGEIQEKEQSCYHHIGKGLHQWKHISEISPDFCKEFTYTWWVVRRFVAWAAKIPDEHMPPIEPGEINDKAKKIISKNILWDGSLLDLMNNI